LGVTASDLARIIEFDGEVPAIVAPRRAFGDTRTEAIVELTYVILAALHGRGVEWVPAATIREAADDLGVLDGNFGRTLQQLRGEGVRVRGDGARREVKINAAGIERAHSVFERLLARLAR